MVTCFLHCLPWTASAFHACGTAGQPPARLMLVCAPHICLPPAADGMPINAVPRKCNLGIAGDPEARLTLCRGHRVALDVAQALYNMHEVGLDFA